MASSDYEEQHTPEYNALLEMTEDLCNALPINDLIPKMISKRVITFQDKENIRTGPTDREKVDIFISILTKELVSRENKRFYNFIKVMKESPKCDFLVERMERKLGKISQSQLQGTPPVVPAAGKIINYCIIFTCQY